MAFECKAGSFSAATGTGNQSVTGLGFAPKLVLFFMGDQTADATGPDSQFNIGVADGTKQFAVSPNSEDAAAITAASGQLNATRCVILNAAGTTVSVRTASFVSLDADGFTVNWIESGSAYKVGYLALGGADLTSVDCGSFTTPSSTGTQAITGVGFQPDCILTISTRGTDAGIMIGAADGTNQFLVGNASEDNKSTSDTYRYEVSTKCVGLLNNTSVLAEGSLQSFDSDGFTLNWSTASAFGNDHYYVALKGGSYEVGSDTQNTTTGTKATSVSGFTPVGVLLASANKTVGSTVVAGASVSMGVASSATDRAHLWAGDADGQATTQADNDWDSAAALKMITPGATPTLNAEADLDSFASGSFTLDWVTADATARGFSFVAFGDATGGGATVTLTTATETSTANSVSVVNPRTYTLGTASESEAANAVTVQQAAAVSLGNATETDVANAVSVVNPRSYQLGNATDSSAANALSVVNPRSYTLGNASESDTANAVTITNASTVSLGTASESCVANSLTISNPRTYTLTTASEVSIGRAVTVVNPRSYSLGNAIESNAANALTVSLQGQTTAGYILVRNATLKTGKATATLRTGRATATLIS